MNAAGELNVVLDVRHLDPDLMHQVRETIIKEKARVEGLSSEGSGQLIMFPEYAEEISVPLEIAENVRAGVLATLKSKGLGVNLTDDQFKVVAAAA